MKRRTVIITVAVLAVGIIGVFAVSRMQTKADTVPVMSNSVETVQSDIVEEPEQKTEQTLPATDEEPEQTEEAAPIEPEQDDTEQEETDVAPEESETIEEVVEDIEKSTGIVIVEELDQTLYAQSNCNGRSGDGTNYDIVTTVEQGAQLHVTGLTENDWYRVQWGDGELYISSSLLATTPPSTSSSTNTGSDGSYGFTQQELQRIDDILKQFSEENGGGAVSNGPGTSWNID